MKTLQKQQKEELRRHKLRLVKELVERTLPELGGFNKQTHQNLASVLTVPIREYGLIISKQVLWGWANGRYLPKLSTIELLAKVAEEETLAKKFADEVLEILRLKETPAQVNIKELGYS